jgi:hypothetical protein
MDSDQHARARVLRYHTVPAWVTSHVMTNATAAERAVFDGERFCSGLPMTTLLQGEHCFTPPPQPPLHRRRP